MIDHIWKPSQQAVCVRQHNGCGAILRAVYTVLGVRTEELSTTKSVQLLAFIDANWGECWLRADDFEPLNLEKAMNVAGRDPRGVMWLVKGRGPASHEHQSEELADAEAKRLAKQSPGEMFTVLGPLRSYCREDVSVTDLSEELETGYAAVPF